MKTKLMAMLLMASGALFAETRFSIGVHIGGPAIYGPVPVAPGPVFWRPPCPGPGYAWVDGYYDPYGTWFDGYWAVPPYAGAYWVAPRYYGGRYYRGYWGGPRYGYREVRPFRPYGRERHEHEFRGRGGDFDHGHGFREGRGRGFGRGFRR